MIVLKFGGSSLQSAAKIRRCVAIIGRQIDRNPVVVVSAMGKTTDRLLEAARRALEGKVDTAEIEAFHLEAVKELGIEKKLIENLLYKLEALLHGISLLKELTPRTLDQVLSFGEWISSCVVAAALTGEGIPAASVSAWDIGLLTDSNFAGASPLPGIDAEIRRRLGAFKEVPVITGFIAKDAKGNITTLGRSGSDFSASIIGAAMDAEEIQIWTDVDGVMTADPDLAPEARNLPMLSFNEASELAHYGAEVLHPSTLIPAIEKKIPVRVANTGRPDDPGTKIVAGSALTNRIAKSIVYKENLVLINVVSQRFSSTARLLSHALGVLTGRGIDIHGAATSEWSVSFVTDRPYDDETLEGAAAGLRECGAVTIERGRALICVVGEELRGNPAVLGRIFTAVGASGINARMVAQSASGINIGFIVDNTQIARAVTSLHKMLLGGG